MEFRLPVITKETYSFTFKKIDGGVSAQAPDTDIEIPVYNAIDIALFAKNVMGSIADADWSVANSANSGSLTESTTYYIQVSAVDSNGTEVKVSNEKSHTTGTGITAIDVTLPDDTNYTYNVYIGTGTGNLQTAYTGTAVNPTALKNQTAGSTVTITLLADANADPPRPGERPPQSDNTDIYLIASLDGGANYDDQYNAGVNLAQNQAKIVLVNTGIDKLKIRATNNNSKYAMCNVSGTVLVIRRK